MLCKLWIKIGILKDRFRITEDVGITGEIAVEAGKIGGDLDPIEVSSNS